MSFLSLSSFGGELLFACCEVSCLASCLDRVYLSSFEVSFLFSSSILSILVISSFTVLLFII